MPVRRFRRLHERISAHRAAATLDMIEAFTVAQMSGSDRTEAISDLTRRVTGEDEKIVTVSSAEDLKQLIQRANAAAVGRR